MSKYMDDAEYQNKALNMPVFYTPLPPLELDMDEFDRSFFRGWQAIRKRRRTWLQRRAMWHRRGE